MTPDQVAAIAAAGGRLIVTSHADPSVTRAPAVLSPGTAVLPVGGIDASNMAHGGRGRFRHRLGDLSTWRQPRSGGREGADFERGYLTST